MKYYIVIDAVDARNWQDGQDSSVAVKSEGYFFPSKELALSQKRVKDFLYSSIAPHSILEFDFLGKVSDDQ